MQPENQESQNQQMPPQPAGSPLMPPTSENQSPPIYPAPAVQTPPPAYASPEVPKKSKIRFLLPIIIVLLLVSGAAAFTLHKTPIKKNTSSTAKGVANCDSESCFTPHFKDCSPSELTAASPIADVKYKINGKQSSGCNMFFEYTSNLNPAWVNQPMTCNFDNTKGLEDSVGAVISDLSNKSNSYGCSGPLVKILQNL